MPANELMGWNKDQRRWFKKYRGKIYSVSPRQLKCQPTKEASRQAANEWWAKKQAEIDEKTGAGKETPHSRHQAIRLCDQKSSTVCQVATAVRRPGGRRSRSHAGMAPGSLKTDDPPFPLDKTQEDHDGNISKICATMTGRKHTYWWL